MKRISKSQLSNKIRQTQRKFERDTKSEIRKLERELKRRFK